jgi:hypothetical protein
MEEDKTIKKLLKIDHIPLRNSSLVLLKKFTTKSEPNKDSNVTILPEHWARLMHLLISSGKYQHWSPLLRISHILRLLNRPQEKHLQISSEKKDLPSNINDEPLNPNDHKKGLINSLWIALILTNRKWSKKI